MISHNNFINKDTNMANNVGNADNVGITTHHNIPMNNINDIHIFIESSLLNGTNLNNIYHNFIEVYPSLKNDVQLVLLIEYDYDVKNKVEQNYLSETRKYQKNLRKYALNKFNKCVISGITENRRLECAHIKPVHNSNNFEKCDVDNVLLLWIDIHRYFDNYDITINPVTKKVEVNLENNKTKWLHGYNNKYVGNLSCGNLKYLEYHHNKCKQKWNHNVIYHNFTM